MYVESPLFYLFTQRKDGQIMQFSENQKYYLKRFAALHMPEIDRKAAYVRQELKTTWMAVDTTSVADGVVYVYHN